MKRAVLLAGLLLVASACHHGWVRPGATEQDFLRDYDCCRYGCDEQQQSGAAAGRQQEGEATRRMKRKRLKVYAVQNDLLVTDLIEAGIRAVLGEKSAA